MFLLCIFAAIALYEGVKDEVTSTARNWRDSKIESARNKWSKKKEAIRGKRSKRGRKRLRDLPARGGLNLLDALWSFGRAVRNGARGSVDRGREMRDRYQEHADLPRRERMRVARRPQEPPAQNSAQTSAQESAPPESTVHDPATRKFFGYRCGCGESQNGFDSEAAAAEALTKHKCPHPTRSPGQPGPNTGGSMPDVNTLEQLRIANAKLVSAAVVDLEDATADKQGAEEEVARAEQEVTLINGVADQVSARWNPQNAEPYLDMAANARATLDAARVRVAASERRRAAAEAKVVAAQRGTAEVEKLVAADEAMRAAGFRSGVDSAANAA